MLRDTPPFRADHVGILLRPRDLLQAREDLAGGRIEAADLRAIEDRAVLDVIALQCEAGLQTATDGEFRRGSWHMDFIYALEGISKAQDNLTVHFKNADGAIDFTPAALRVTGRLGVADTSFGEDFGTLRDHTGDATAKLTIPSPSMVH